MSENLMGPAKCADQSKKVHWSQHPWKFFGWTVVAMFANYLVQICLAMALQPLSASSPFLCGTLIVLAGFAVTAVFYLIVRASRKKHGSGEPILWRIGVAFWVGLVPLALYVAMRWLPAEYEIYFAMNYAPLILSYLSSLLFAALLYPVLERKMGAVKGALLFGAAKALAALLENAVNILVSRTQGGQMPDILGDLVPNALAGCVAAFAVGVLLIALFHAASRRIMGSWMLFSAVQLWLTAANAAIKRGLFPNTEPFWLGLCADLAFWLVVFAVSFGFIAAFQRWKTFGAFWKDAKVLVRRTQGDVKE